MSWRLGSKFGKKRVFRDHESLLYGDVWDGAIMRELEGCRAVVVIIGKEWLPGKVLTEEISKANERKILIPVVVEGADVNEVLAERPDLACLGKYQHGKLTDEFLDELFKRLIKSLRARGVELLGMRYLRLAALVAVLALGTLALLLYGNLGTAMIATGVATVLLGLGFWFGRRGIA
jgi:hypothetical protein